QRHRSKPPVFFPSTRVEIVSLDARKEIALSIPIDDRWIGSDKCLSSHIATLEPFGKHAAAAWTAALAWMFRACRALDVPITPVIDPGMQSLRLNTDSCPVDILVAAGPLGILSAQPHQKREYLHHA